MAIVASVTFLASGVASMAAPVGAATRDLSPLKSTPAPRTTPQLPVGDFSNAPPSPADASARRPVPKGAGFDPTRSTPLDTLTTPTRRLYINADGSRTAVVTQSPVRFKDASGRWVDDNLNLQRGADGSLGATAAAATAHLAANAAGPMRLPTAAGDITLRLPDAAATSEAAVSGERATYPGALGAGRDLTLTLAPGGGGAVGGVGRPEQPGHLPRRVQRARWHQRP